MAARKSASSLPAPLERARKRFEDWRRHRKERRIPDALWSSAEKLAVEFGVHRTSRALRLNYDYLKERVETHKPVARVGDQGSSPFVELVPVAPVSTSEGVLDLEDPEGARMRVEWRGEIPDLSALSQTFFSAP